MANFSADQTLELVKDASKFKAKLEELAKAEVSAKEAMAKSKQMNKEVFADIDAAHKELARIKAEQKRVLDEGTKPLEAANEDLRKREARLNTDRKGFDAANDKVKYERDAIQAEKANLKEREVAFAERVNAFEKVVQAVCKNA